MKRFTIFTTAIVVFWNLENFFLPFSPNFEKKWTSGNFYQKCDGIAKTILEISEISGQYPDAIAVEEVENRKVLQKLLSSTILRKLDYSIIHYESNDPRGIDCALFYRPSRLRLLYSKPVPIVSPEGDTLKTRDILLAAFETPEGDSLAVFVNHHPSKISSGSDYRRNLALKTLATLADTIQIRNILSGGDFNEEFSSTSDSILFPVLRELHDIPARNKKSVGTIKFNGKWESIDRVQTAGNIKASVKIFAAKSLSEKDLTYGGLKPKRTFSGPRYLGGISDHYPIIVEIQSLSTFAKPQPVD